MRKNNTILDLTPFLDVILVILFLVLVQSEVRVDVIYAEAREEYTARQEAFAEEVDALRQTAADFDVLRLGLEEEPNVIAISLLPNAEDRGIRSILVEATAQVIQIELCWDGVIRDNAAMALNIALSEGVQNADSPVTFVVFKFDSTNIFAADHRLISIAIHNLKLNHPHIFSAELNLR